MSPLVSTAPASARVDRAATRRMRAAVSTAGPLLTKRRPVDFGLVTSCLCRCA